MLASVVPSHSFAAWLIAFIDRYLDRIGLSKDPEIEEFIYIVLIVGIAMLIGWLLRVVVLFMARRYVALRNGEAGREFLHQGVLQKMSHVIPPLVILAWLPFAFEATSMLLSVFERCLIVYTIVAFVLALCALCNFVWLRYDKNNNEKNLPLKGILNSVKGVIWIVAVIIALSVLVGKSPGSLLAGLGAFAAALMLIFKNSILGFVAGIQLSQNDMLHVGDWIVVPSTIANGIVTDVSLTTIKVRNWDNTTVTLPPYTLVSECFQNWRGMSDSGVRQIARSITVVTTSVKQIDGDFIKRVSEKLPDINPFIDQINKGGGKDLFSPGTAVVNGTTDTNLGLLRAYLCQYLINNPNISNDWQILVRTLAPTSTGLPLQLWCYTTTTNFTAYEAIQSAIFEHIAMVASVFELQLFNYSSDNDITTVEMVPRVKADNSGLSA